MMIIEYLHVRHYSKCLIRINAFSSLDNVVWWNFIIIIRLWRGILEFNQGPTANR